MLAETLNCVFYLATIFSLFLIDYLLGNGFFDTVQKLFCKFVVSFVRKSIGNEEKSVLITGNEYILNLPALITEIVFLGLTITILNKYKHYRGKDKIDDLLQESSEALRQTNEFLERWRLRRVKSLIARSTINWQKSSEHSYLDEEPQEIKPYKLEVPILHMAIVDTLGTSRNQLERGDAADSTNIIDSTLLSMTSLLDDDLQSLPELSVDDKNDDDITLRDRYLWDVLEEDFEE